MMCVFSYFCLSFFLQFIVVGTSEKSSVGEVLEAASNKRQLNPADHFIRLKLNGENYKIPEKSALLHGEVKSAGDRA